MLPPRQYRLSNAVIGEMNNLLYAGEVFAFAAQRPKVELRRPVELPWSATDAKIAHHWLQELDVGGLVFRMLTTQFRGVFVSRLLPRLDRRCGQLLEQRFAIWMAGHQVMRLPIDF